jgi:hypothetical protein
MSDARLITHEFDSRRADLDHIQSVLDDPKKGKWAKGEAHLAKTSIMRQLGDRTLQQLRERLSKAVRAYDDIGQWKIGNQIREHMGEPLLIKPV